MTPRSRSQHFSGNAAYRYSLESIQAPLEEVEIVRFRLLEYAWKGYPESSIGSI